jgi:hypothetical protein
MRTIPTKAPLLELEAILKDMDIFDNIELDELVSIDQWNGDLSCYLVIDGSVQRPNGNIVTGIEEYDRELLVNIYINIDLTKYEKLYHLDLVDSIESKILDDLALWNYVNDREIFGSVWGITKENKKQGKIICSLSFRSCGI